ncbi:MAG: nucleoside-diphosphate kinase [Fermentimonas sp.]|nr:nucleoside-diphosphate kinase [Fermentimonas sp.]
MQVTLAILKPSAVQRGILGEVISRFEKKGLQIVGMKMLNLTENQLHVHYSHLVDKPYFGRIKDSMQASPVIVMALKGVDAVNVVRKITGVTNGREATPGTIRGDFSISVQENIVHTSDSSETAEIELKRFFETDEIFNYSQLNIKSIYAGDEY